MSEPLSPALIEEFRRLDTCVVSNAIETFDLRLRNQGFMTGSVRCLFDDRSPVLGFAVTATIRSATPPPVGHAYVDRTDWWNAIRRVPTPRIVAVQDLDDPPGAGAFVGEVHAAILHALGCVAYVTNGTVRDLPGLRRSQLQAFAAGTSPSHAFAHIVGFGDPIEIAGLPIATGDLLFGDRHGIVSVPPGLASRLPAAVASMRMHEQRVIEFCGSPDFTLDALRSLVQDWN